MWRVDIAEEDPSGGAEDAAVQAEEDQDSRSGSGRWLREQEESLRDLGVCLGRAGATKRESGLWTELLRMCEEILGEAEAAC